MDRFTALDQENVVVTTRHAAMDAGVAATQVIKQAHDLAEFERKRARGLEAKLRFVDVVDSLAAARCVIGDASD